MVGVGRRGQGDGLLERPEGGESVARLDRAVGVLEGVVGVLYGDRVRAVVVGELDDDGVGGDDLAGEGDL